MVRVKSNFCNVGLINVYPSMEDKHDSTNNKYYSCLESVFDSLFSIDMKIVLANSNAKIGKELAHHRTTGVHSLHGITNNGKFI